ncbi:hypothetical protein I317_05528 [Kwoniella heveanensis CBS 569]|uniref:Thioredoxin domain-containing protein n=1 Tax=Kwoniella heveanensis BCC8398 TaxID=1296120 RepID=A0A1B9GTJ1_9TREE|nr:hypothetical protein I316_03865 [Kwoniella heveanensis BCC8398]OCF40679.1 hypothetical protein I317_05528 [Kwoniella heveanensis CBS 569]
MPLHATPYPHVMNSLNGPTAPEKTFLVFYSNVVNGQMWCPDCRDVEQVVKDTFDGADKPKAIIYWVGTIAEWRTPKNSARVDWNVQSVPTILRIENGKETARLVEGEILDAGRLAAFVQ